MTRNTKLTWPLLAISLIVCAACFSWPVARVPEVSLNIVQAESAAGWRPEAVSAWLRAQQDPAAAEWGAVPMALAAFQLPDGGFRAAAGDEESDLLAMAKAIPALAGVPLPLAIACGSGAPEGNGCVSLAPAA